jgi:FG-GAP repeat
VRPKTGWSNATETALLTASDGTASDGFGSGLGISGPTVLVGAPSAAVGSNYDEGAAYIFVKPATGWTSATETARLTASDGKAYDGFGWSASVSGKTAAVGAIDSDHYKGWAYVYSEPRSGWKTTSKFEAKLRGHDVKRKDDFANNMSLNGRVLVVGAGLGGRVRRSFSARPCPCSLLAFSRLCPTSGGAVRVNSSVRRSGAPGWGRTSSWQCRKHRRCGE